MQASDWGQRTWTKFIAAYFDIFSSHTIRRAKSVFSHFLDVGNLHQPRELVPIKIILIPIKIILMYNFFPRKGDCTNYQGVQIIINFTIIRVCSSSLTHNMFTENIHILRNNGWLCVFWLQPLLPFLKVSVPATQLCHHQSFAFFCSSFPCFIIRNYILSDQQQGKHWVSEIKFHCCSFQLILSILL